MGIFQMDLSDGATGSFRWRIFQMVPPIFDLSDGDLSDGATHLLLTVIFQMVPPIFC